uniref:Titin n=1 Tax=Syphacia muris TaxID=451379 RepID=A0A0N5ALY1_9BILA
MMLLFLIFAVAAVLDRPSSLISPEVIELAPRQTTLLKRPSVFITRRPKILLRESPRIVSKTDSSRLVLQEPSRLVLQKPPRLVLQESPRLILQASPRLVLQEPPRYVLREPPKLLIRDQPKLILPEDPHVLVPTAPKRRKRFTRIAACPCGYQIIERNQPTYNVKTKVAAPVYILPKHGPVVSEPNRIRRPEVAIEAAEKPKIFGILSEA